MCYPGDYDVVVLGPDRSKVGPWHRFPATREPIRPVSSERAWGPQVLVEELPSARRSARRRTGTTRIVRSRCPGWSTNPVRTRSIGVATSAVSAPTKAACLGPSRTSVVEPKGGESDSSDVRAAVPELGGHPATGQANWEQ